MTLTWGTPVRLSNADDEAWGMNAHLCAVSDTVMAVAWSRGGFRTAIQAIDISGSSPVLGPRSEWHELPDDPLGQTFGDLSFVVPMGDGVTFGLTGEAGATYDAAGNHDFSGAWAPVASYFRVNPDLSIDRVELDLFDWTVHNRWVDEPTACFSPGGMDVLLLDGALLSSSLGGAPLLTSVVGNNPSAITSSGSDRYYWAGDSVSGYTLHRWSSATGSAPLGLPVTTNPNNFSFFGATDPTGGVVYQVALNPAVNNLQDVTLVRAPSGTSLTLPGVEARVLGHNGGWYFNVHPVSVWPDGQVIMGYVQDGIDFNYTILDADDSILESGPVADFHNFSPSNTYAAELYVAGNYKVGSIFIPRTVSTAAEYGLFFVLGDRGEPVIDGALKSTGRRFI